MVARAKPYEQALSISNERRLTTKLRLAPEPGKGRPPLRACPPDFDVVFVEVGRLDCETYYRAARITVDRWLIERGKERLIKARAEFVDFRRRQTKEIEKAKLEAIPVADAAEMQISLCLARAAAHHLRQRRSGGWVVTRKLDGSYVVGVMRKTAAEMLAMAVAAGFDADAAMMECSIEDLSDGQER